MLLLVNIQEAAEILELHPKTVRRMLSDGRLQGMVIPPNAPGGRSVYRLDANYVHQVKTGLGHKPKPKLNLEALSGQKKEK